MTESAFNRPTPVQEQQAARKAEPKPGAEEAAIVEKLIDPPQPIPGTEPSEDPATTELRRLTRDMIGREEAALGRALPMEGGKLSAAELSAMQQRIAEAIDNDLETRARVAAIPVSGFAAQITEERGVRYEGTFQGDPIISNPAMPPGVVARVRLTAEQIEATKHLKPGEAWAKAGEVLEPEPAKKPEDLDGF